MNTISPRNFHHTAFWGHIHGHLARCPGLVQVVAIYLAFTDPATPAFAKAILGGALLYFVLPLDAVPDWIPVAGIADDIAVAGGVLAAAAGAWVSEQHRQRAREILGFK